MKLEDETRQTSIGKRIDIRPTIKALELKHIMLYKVLITTNALIFLFASIISYFLGYYGTLLGLAVGSYLMVISVVWLYQSMIGSQ